MLYEEPYDRLITEDGVDGHCELLGGIEVLGGKLSHPLIADVLAG
jgi:hypothetical protein